MGVGEAVLIQPDDKILVGATALEGHLGVGNTALTRFNSDGSLDATFAGRGTVVVGAVGGANALAVLSDGEILVVNHSGIVQFTSTGTLESAVTGGAPTVSSPGGVFLADGHFFDPETVSTGKHISDAQVFELNPNGSADTAFENSTFVFLPGGMSSARSTAFQFDGKVVVGGGIARPALAHASMVWRD